MRPEPIPCPLFPSRLTGFGSERPRDLAHVAPLPLRQAWLGPDACPAQRALAYLGRDERGLRFYVWMEDANVWTSARRDQEKMWTLGDTVEFFVKPGPERADYWEVHVTPNDRIMDIRIPQRDEWLAGRITWETVVAPDSGSRKRVGVWQTPCPCWAVDLAIPWAAFGLSAAPATGTCWQVAVCRYDYAGPGTAPVLSSTAELTQRSFHHYEDYHDVLVGAG